MSHAAKLSLCIVCVLSLGVVAGCKKETKPAAPAAPPAAAPAPAAEQPKTDATEQPKTGAVATPEIELALAKLSTEDRALAEKQKICPVSSHALGSMDTPKKISVAGQEVFICCEACEQPLRDEPEKFLAVINLKPAEAAAVKN